VAVLGEVSGNGLPRPDATISSSRFPQGLA
jgi:hypothetical protein